MKGKHIETQLAGHRIKSLLFSLSLLLLLSHKAIASDNARYSVLFNTNRSACMVRVNDFPMIDNFSYSSGTISTAFNITAFAENGKNKIEVLMGALDPDDKSTLYPDSRCELVITKDTENTSQQITKITLSVDTQGEIILSNDNNTQKEPRIDETHLAEDQQLQLHGVSRDVNLTNLPIWSWVNATPVSEKALPKIHDVYRVIWNTLKARNIDLMKEMAITEGMAPDDIFKSYGLPENVMNSELSPINFNLSDYKLMTYCNGRVFRLAQGIDQNSPLRLQDKDGEIVFAYNPYFSIIKGKIFIVR